MNNPERYFTPDSVSANFYRKAEIISSLIPHAGIPVDLGCWDGRLARLFLKDFTGTSIGADYVPQARAVAAHNMVVSCEFERAPLPFQDGSVDCLFLGEVIEHIYDTDFLMLEIRRVLKTGGCLVCTTPNLSSLLNQYDQRRLTKPWILGYITK